MVHSHSLSQEIKRKYDDDDDDDDDEGLA